MDRRIRIGSDRQIGRDAYPALYLYGYLLRCAVEPPQAPNVEHNRIRRGFLKQRRKVSSAFHQQRKIAGGMQAREHKN